MTIGTKSLIGCVNTKIADAETQIEILQLASVARDFDQGFVKSVANCAALPPAAANEGRLIYLEDRCSYRWSDGVEWTNDFTSTIPGTQIWSFGRGITGRLGDNTVVDKSSPVLVVGGFTDWCQASAGGIHSLGIRSNGTLWAWGYNVCGRLGDNTTVSKRSPVSVVGGFTNWCQASAGGNFSLGLRSNGTLWAWGNGTDGRLGNLSILPRSSPVSVAGGFTDWCQVSAGSQHSLAVRSNGTLRSWGNGECGVLGIGEREENDRSSPALVIGGFTDWCQASAGGSHSLGLRSNGTLWSWGRARDGRLGRNSGDEEFLGSPGLVAGGFTDWCQASAGGGHSLAVRTNGTMWAWGVGSAGLLGNGATTSRTSPVSVVGGFTDWCQASAGTSHSLGIRQNGSLWAWGCNQNGVLGDNTTVNKSSPVSVVGGFGNWCQVSAANHTLAVRPIKGF